MNIARTGLRWCCAAMTLCFALHAGAQTESGDAAKLRAEMAGTGLRVPQNFLELGYSRENLTKNYSDWTSTYLLGGHKFGERRTFYGGLRETRRYGLDDMRGPCRPLYSAGCDLGWGGRRQLERYWRTRPRWPTC